MRFDLVITDLMMPERDGLELLEFLRYLSAPPRIMAISGAWDGACLAMASKLGAQAVLPKPWRRDELLAAVRSLIGEPAKPPKEVAISVLAAQIESA
jgi:CheY-like chemotaxis protein